MGNALKSKETPPFPVNVGSGADVSLFVMSLTISPFYPCVTHDTYLARTKLPRREEQAKSFAQCIYAKVGLLLMRYNIVLQRHDVVGCCGRVKSHGLQRRHGLETVAAAIRVHFDDRIHIAVSA